MNGSLGVLAGLQFLQYLDVSNNGFTGPVPIGLSLLTGLTSLNIAFNYINDTMDTLAAMDLVCVPQCVKFTVAHVDVDDTLTLFVGGGMV